MGPQSMGGGNPFGLWVQRRRVDLPPRICYFDKYV